MQGLVERHAAHFSSLQSGEIMQTEVVAALINTKDSIVEGIRYVQEVVEGSISILLLAPDNVLYAARDRWGRTPVVIGRKESGFAASFESSAFPNLGYEHVRDLGPGEVVRITQSGVETLQEPGPTERLCSFLHVYYGYPASSYNGRNVEYVRYRCGAALSKVAPVEADAVAGIPDSGVGHALGYADKSGIKYARPYVKYTPTWPRSFMPSNQAERQHIAQMKLIPIPQLIEGKKLVFCDDSIVRGTQMRDQMKRVMADGAKEVHVRIACPPLLYGCPFINFSRSKSEMDLITRRIIRDLDGEGAPIHVANFCELAESGFYDGLKFHRYVPGFVIQGGCPNTRDMTPEEVAAGKSGKHGHPGTGNPGYRIREEFTTNPRNLHEDGALAMARSQDPNSAGSQFYLCLGPQHRLDSGYTVFGQTIEGLEVISLLRAGDTIQSIRIEHAAN